MSAFFSFLKSKQFFIHFTAVILVISLIFFLTVKWLSSYTHHGEYIQVPDFKGLELDKLKDFIADKKVSYEIIDSIYDPKQKPGIVLRQDPEANSKVKHNRTVYLSVTGMVAPKIKMPKLVDRSERMARQTLGTYGLRMGPITEKQAHCNGCVIAQLINGKEVAEGELVKKGSIVNLVIGVKDNFYTPSAVDTNKVEEPNFE